MHFLPLNVEVPVRDFDDMVADKVLKLSAAARLARSQGCDYVVFNDADDLVSNRIGAFVAGRPGANGWYTTSQFFYTYGGRLMRRQPIASPASGPCVIVRTDLLTFERPPFTAEWARIIAAGGEQRYLRLPRTPQRRSLRACRRRHRPLPLVHGRSWPAAGAVPVRRQRGD